jgi:hypothetical protein
VTQWRAPTRISLGVAIGTEHSKARNTCTDDGQAAATLVFRALSKGSVMTQACCPSCRLRFARAVAAYLVACPDCGEPPQPVPSAENVLGFRLASDDPRSDSLPVALAVALPVPTRSET